METEQLIRQLKYESDKHRNDKLFTFQTNITAMCNDIIPKLEKLKEYEDAEKNGTLNKFPCKVGGTLYRIRHGNVQELVVWGIDMYEMHLHTGVEFHISINCMTKAEHEYCNYEIDDVGKYIFVTEEGALNSIAESEADI